MKSFIHVHKSSEEVSKPKPMNVQSRVPASFRALLKRIGREANEAGIEAYAVGGCVRDWVIGTSATPDLDVVVEGDGIAFARRLAAALRAELTTHQQFGTSTLVVPQRLAALRLDVATCRKETYREPAAYPKVAPGTLRDDLFRRDFTINAMAMALGARRFGELVDPFEGWRDLRAKRLRVLHAASFRDDPTRILRAARFAARFGLALEAQTRRRLAQAAAGGWLSRVNRGRLHKELIRMAEEPDPTACLVWLGRRLQNPPARPSRRPGRAKSKI